MVNGILSLISLIVGIALMVRWGLFRRLFPAFLAQRILDKLSDLEVSAPSLKSTSSNSNSTCASSI